MSKPMHTPSKDWIRCPDCGTRQINLIKERKLFQEDSFSDDYTSFNALKCRKCGKKETFGDEEK